MNYQKQFPSKTSLVLLTPEELDQVTHDRIAITELIGVGLTGVVYKAEQTSVGRTVAVKVLSKIEKTAFSDVRERFMLEAKALGRLNHPNIVRVHDIGETKNGFPYLVREYVEGIDLACLIRGGQLTLEHVTSWIPQACEALEYAHNHELVHRGIKPTNLVIDLEGRVKITDFGLVKVKSLPDWNYLTQAQLPPGTRSYFAPETFVPGATVDHRADVYSMGIVLYEMLTGKLPTGKWVPPSSLRAGLNPRFDEIVVRALQSEPTHRYPRIADMGRDVLALGSGGASGGGGGPALQSRKNALAQGTSSKRAMSSLRPRTRADW